MATSAVIAAIVWATVNSGPDIHPNSAVPVAAIGEAVSPESVVRKAGRNLKARLVRVQPEKRRMTVRLKWSGVKTFDVADVARITRHGTPASLRKLRHDDQLRLRVRMVSIDLGGAGPKRNGGRFADRLVNDSCPNDEGITPPPPPDSKIDNAFEGGTPVGNYHD